MKQWNNTHTQKTHFVLVSYSRALDLFWRWLIDAARFHWRKLIFSSQQVSVANSSLARGKTLCTFLLRAEMKILFYSNRRITRILYFLGFFFFKTIWQLHQSWFSSPKWCIFQPVSIKCFKMNKVSGLSTSMLTSFKIIFYKFSCYHFINFILLYLKNHYKFFTVNSNTEWLISTDPS